MKICSAHFIVQVQNDVLVFQDKSLPKLGWYGNKLKWQQVWKIIPQLLPLDSQDVTLFLTIFDPPPSPSSLFVTNV
jgi:hypothetical protein